MHDIDSTRLETGPDHYEHEQDTEFEFAGSQYNGQSEDRFEMPMTEAEEEALAAELLGVSSELEMDQFLGGLFRKIKRGIGGAARILRNAGPLAGALKGIAGRALPFLGGALGTAIPIPGLGTALGSKLGGIASKLLQSELENLEFEDQEFEMARRYVRLASQAFRQAARIPARANPRAAVNFALRNAFQSLRGRGGFRPRPIYWRYSQCAPCPPPEPCPTCSQPLPAPDSSPHADTGAQSGGSHEPPSAPPVAKIGADAGTGGEFEFEDAGEFEDGGQGEGEGEYYETDNEFLAGAGGGRGGRWVRRGRRIILYGL